MDSSSTAYQSNGARAGASQPAAERVRLPSMREVRPLPTAPTPLFATPSTSLHLSLLTFPGLLPLN